MTQRRRRNYRNRVYTNMKLFLDNKLVERGWYDNVASGETDWHGNNQSQVLPVQNDSLYPVDSGTTVHVWQGYRRNWVSESGMQPFTSGLTDPTIPRGVYVDGVYSASKAFGGGDGVAIDFRNGRVILEAGATASQTVEVPHSYKEVWVDTISRDMITTQITSLDNTRRVIVNNVPSGEIGQLPMILLEIGAQDSPRGRQLGGGQILLPSIFCHVITNNRWDKDELIDFLQQRKDETIQMVDMDVVPAQFTYEGDFATGWITYRNLIANYKDKDAFIKSVELIQNDDIAEDSYFTAILRMDLEIWTNEQF